MVEELEAEASDYCSRLAAAAEASAQATKRHDAKLEQVRAQLADQQQLQTQREVELRAARDALAKAEEQLRRSKASAGPASGAAT